MAGTDTASQIEDLAQLQFSDQEIATIMEIEPEELLKHHRQNVDRGRLLAEAEVRKSMLQLARQGSTPAQKEFMALNRKAKRHRR